MHSLVVAQNPLLVPAAAHSGEFLGAAAVVVTATLVTAAAAAGTVAVAAIAVAAAAIAAAAVRALAPMGTHYNCTEW